MTVCHLLGFTVSPRYLTIVCLFPSQFLSLSFSLSFPFSLSCFLPPTCSIDPTLFLVYILMFKRKESGKFLDLTPPRTRVHDAVTFRTVKLTNKSFERSIYFKGAREWNNLDINTCTRNIPTLALFKQHQKCWLKSTVT